MIHPGKLFLQDHPFLESECDVFEFVEFLRLSSSQNDLIPVDLTRIYKHFEIPIPVTVELPNQQGLLVDSEKGIILINSTDPQTRRRFTEAHELIELLFAEYSKFEISKGINKAGKIGNFKIREKENICNRAAANLLMPPKTIQSLIEQSGCNFECARRISDSFRVSFIAALIQMVRNCNERYSVVLWKIKNKPSELKKYTSSLQPPLFDVNADWCFSKKLRVEWSMSNTSQIYIPKDKSTEKWSLIYKTWETGDYTTGKERMNFDNRKPILCNTENCCFNIMGERLVISLVKRIGS